MPNDKVVVPLRPDAGEAQQPPLAGAVASVLSDAGEKRKPGRPRGLPKTGGRQKGTGNRVTADLRQLIIDQAKPDKFLADIVTGRRVRVGPQAGPGEAIYEYPTLEQRLKAAAILLGKVLPDIKAVEHSGPDGKAIQNETRLSAAETVHEAGLAAARALGLIIGQKVTPRPSCRLMILG